jgi:dipeptidase
MKKKIFTVLFGYILVFSVFFLLIPFFAKGDETPADTACVNCTNVLVDPGATVDRSSIISHCEDGGLVGRVERVPAQKHRKGTMIPIYNQNLQLTCEIPQVSETYAYTHWFESQSRHGPQWSQSLSGMNEHGLVVVGPLVAILTRPEAQTKNGRLMNICSKPLHEFALERCKTAREAIKLMGDLVCEYGWNYVGTGTTITDGKEAWSMEIIGAGAAWTPGCGKPGAVWVAQRIPNGHVYVYANRSRIGKVNLDDHDYFMASPNIYSFAQEMGWWNPGKPFVWYDVFFTRGPIERTSSLREWSALNSVAPSLGLDPEVGRWPFSVKPDKPISVQDVMAIHRNYLDGTPYDVTEKPAWLVAGKKSPMACPWGPEDLHKLIGVSPERSIASHRNNWTHVSQVRANLPDPIKVCMWSGFGPAASSCFAPIYSGTAELPKSWTYTDKDKVNRENSWWSFHLVQSLSSIQYQKVIEDIKGVRDPAEARFLAKQQDIEKTIIELYSSRSETAAQKLAERLVTQYTNDCLHAVSNAWWKLVDYLLFKYYSRVSVDVPQELPVVDSPAIPIGE